LSPRWIMAARAWPAKRPQSERPHPDRSFSGTDIRPKENPVDPPLSPDGIGMFLAYLKN